MLIPITVPAREVTLFVVPTMQMRKTQECLWLGPGESDHLRPGLPSILPEEGGWDGWEAQEAALPPSACACDGQEESAA